MVTWAMKQYYSDQVLNITVGSEYYTKNVFRVIELMSGFNMHIFVDPSYRFVIDKLKVKI